MPRSTAPCKRKRARTSGDFIVYNEAREKMIKTKAKKRRSQITQRLNFLKRHPSRYQKLCKRRKLHLDVLYLRIQDKFFMEILNGKKNREFRKRIPMYVRQIEKGKHKLFRYVLFLVQNKPGINQMLIEFNGFDIDHKKWKEQYVLKLGEIISTDADRIKELAYRNPNK